MTGTEKRVREVVGTYHEMVYVHVRQFGVDGEGRTWVRMDAPYEDRSGSPLGDWVAVGDFQHGGKIFSSGLPDLRVRFRDLHGTVDHDPHDRLWNHPHLLSDAQRGVSEWFRLWEPLG